MGITKDFVKAVKKNAKWDLKFNGKVYQTIPARKLWNLIIKNAWNVTRIMKNECNLYTQARISVLDGDEQ